MNKFFGYLVFIFGTVQALPMQFQRLILQKDDLIIKIVDLIGDYHVALHKPTKRIKARTKKLLTPQEQKHFVTAERSLIATFRKLIQQKKDLNILWEIEKKSKQQNVDKKFMLYLGSNLRKELENNKNISFIPVDSYRRLMPLTDIYKTKKIYSTQPSSKILKFLKGIRSLAKKDLLLLKKTVSPHTFRKLQRLWEKTNNDVLSLEKKSKQFIHTDQTIANFLKDIQKTKEWKNFQLDWRKTILIEVANIEMLFNIFLAPAKHIILYAGVGHCRIIAQLLEEQFGFKTLIKVGLTEMKKFRISLAPTAWNFLLEKPSFSLRRGLKQALETEDIFNEINQSKNTNELKKALKKGFQAHIDITNFQDKQGMTPLHRFTIARKLDFVNILLLHGAMVNTQDILGNTPLHIASMTNNLPVAKALLAHGANRTIKDKYGKIAVDYAQWPELKKLLK